MATVTFKIVPKDKTFFMGDDDKSNWKPTYKEGQLIFVEDEQKIYLDYDNRRVCYASAEGGGGGAEGATNYLGISTTDPTSGTVKVNGETISSPALHSIVVYGTKEYLYRWGEDENGNPVKGWYEIGDENSPGWEVDE